MTLLAVSCDNLGSDCSDSDCIMFSSYMLTSEVGTRSTFLESFPSGSFGVLGYCVPYVQGSTSPDWAGGNYLWNVKRPNVHADVFYMQEVKYDGSTCKYDYDGNGNLKKWYSKNDYPSVNVDNMDNYYYTFFAYYPFTADKGGFSFSPDTGDGKGAPKIKFTMPFDNTDISDNLDDSLVPDAMVARAANVQRSGGPVSFTFYHLLTGLGFSVVNYNKEHSVIIESVKLQGEFTKSVEVDFSTPEYSLNYSDTYFGTYTIFSGETEVAATDGKIELLGDKHLLLVAGTPDNSTSYFGPDIELVVDYSYNGNKKQATLSRPGSFSPVSGTRYTAQISFVGDSFTLTFLAEENWDNGGDSDITIQ